MPETARQKEQTDMATTSLMFLGPIGTPELVIILIVVLLLFGGKKIPELMRGLGKGVRNFKEGVNGIEEDLKVDLDAPDKQETSIKN